LMQLMVWFGHHFPSRRKVFQPVGTKINLSAPTPLVKLNTTCTWRDASELAPRARLGCEKLEAIEDGAQSLLEALEVIFLEPFREFLRLSVPVNLRPQKIHVSVLPRGCTSENEKGSLRPLKHHSASNASIRSRKVHGTFSVSFSCGGPLEKSGRSKNGGFPLSLGSRYLSNVSLPARCEWNKKIVFCRTAFQATTSTTLRSQLRSNRSCTQQDQARPVLPLKPPSTARVGRAMTGGSSYPARKTTEVVICLLPVRVSPVTFASKPHAMTVCAPYGPYVAESFHFENGDVRCPIRFTGSWTRRHKSSWTSRVSIRDHLWTASSFLFARASPHLYRRRLPFSSVLRVGAAFDGDDGFDDPATCGTFALRRLCVCGLGFALLPPSGATGAAPSEGVQHNAARDGGGARYVSQTLATLMFSSLVWWFFLPILFVFER